MLSAKWSYYGASRPAFPSNMAETWQQSPTCTLPSRHNIIKSFTLQKCRHVKIWKDGIKEERWTGWRRTAWDNKIKAVQELRWIDESIEWRWQPASQRRGQWRRISLRRNDAFKRAKAGRVGSLAGGEKRGIWLMLGGGRTGADEVRA